MPERGAFISGERVYLRGMLPSDADGDYASWMNDPDVTRFLESRYRPHSPEGIREYIASLSGDRGSILFAIVLKDGDRHVGNIKIGPINWTHRRADVGLLIGARDQWGRGLATEAIRLVMRVARERLNLHRLTAGCYAPNEGSAKAFVKAGWQLEGTQRQHWFSEGRYVDGVLLGVVLEETK